MSCCGCLVFVGFVAWVGWALFDCFVFVLEFVAYWIDFWFAKVVVFVIGCLLG